ncbi:putative ribonuclease H-like domain-containing protein [Tanacetum coccineum]
MNKKYCLVVTDDYSRFTWVFFLATKDQTSGILKRFITEIENLVDKKVKIIRCDNETEFKNRVMGEFYEKKGIKKEVSIARTPQQNGVAERRNMTLIEAARTMLADVGSRNGPDWLFDVDSLSKSVNYVPVVAGNQTKGIVGTRDNIVTGQAEKKTEPEQEYILIPICTTNPLISLAPKDSKEDAGVKPTEVDESEASDKDGKDEQDLRSEFERLLQQEKQTEHPNITNSINTVSTPVSTAGQYSTNDAPLSPVNAAKIFEEHLFE